jgi:signal transduction histidine kinase
MLPKGILVAALPAAGVGTPSVPENSLHEPVGARGAGARVRFRIDGAAGWLGARRASTLVTLLAIFTMGPLVLLSVVTVNSTYSALTAASNQKLSDASALAAVYVSTQMKALTTLEDSYAHRQSLVAALRDGNHANYDAPAILTAVKDLRAVQSDTRFAGIIDPAGFFWLNEDPPQPQSSYGRDNTTRDWYQGVTRTGKAYISSAYVSALPGTPLVIAITDPVRADGRYAPSGTVVGILIVGYDLTATQHLFSDFARNQGVRVEVTDQRGAIVALSGAVPTQLVQNTSAGVAAALTGKSSLGRVGIGGEDDFAAYSAVSGIGWTVVTAIPASVALADANRLRGYVILITMVLLALLAAAKVILFVVLRDRQATHLALATANTGLSQKVAARTGELEASNRDLEASNRELEAFSYSVSHDLRSPLRSIDGFSRLVLEENQKGLSPEGTRRLGLIRAGAQQMGLLIDDLLSFSRLGRVELKKRRVYTADIVNEVIAELKQESPDRQIEFVVQDLPHCYADPILLKQVFRNLLGNAVKFTRPRLAARIEVGAGSGVGAGAGTIQAGKVTYFVKDNGVGFDMRYSDKLFGVFQRLHRMEDFPGTGVGLALIRRIVERHGGTVWAKSAVDAGATFYLTLEDGNART